MSEAKEFYKTYLADDSPSVLSWRLINEIEQCEPVHVLEFGMGTGKNLRLFDHKIVTAGIDVSFLNVTHAIARNEIPFSILGDETHLRHLCNFDVVFTCSVLDHIEHIDGIIEEFKRIANKGIFLAETNDAPGSYYYPHDYESLGFEKIDFQWNSQSGDGANYFIWKWIKQENTCAE